jgi:hypothetical protein
MEDQTKERRKLSHNALVESAIRICNQLSSSGDITTRSLANRMFSDLTQLRRGLPQRRQREGASDASSSSTPARAAIGSSAPAATTPPAEKSAAAITAVDATNTCSAQAAQESKHSTGTWFDVEAARHALDNCETDWRTAMTAHAALTSERIRSSTSTVLCVYRVIDRTDRPPKATMSDQAQPGAAILYATTIAAEPLGMLDIRPHSEHVERQPEHAWASRYQSIAERAAKQSTRIVFLSTPRANLVNLIRRAQAMGNPADWLLQASGPEALPNHEQLWQRVCACEALGESAFPRLHAGASSKDEVRLRIWSQRQEISGEDNDKVWVTCLLAREIDPQGDSVPEEWHLLSNRPAQELNGAIDMLNWQRGHGASNSFSALIEEALASANASAEAERGLVLRAIINWRIALLAWRERMAVSGGAALSFTEAEIRGAYLLAKVALPDQAPQLQDMLKILRQLGAGADLRRTANIELATLALGLQRAMDAARVLQSR